MKKRFVVSAIAAAAFAIVPLAGQCAVGVSVDLGEPGFFGRLDIGNYPQPQVIYRDPVVVEAGPRGNAPIYLRVPPGYERDWGRHCREYNACGERVLFVRDEWYNREYAPRYREYHREHREDRREEFREGHRDRRY